MPQDTGKKLFVTRLKYGFVEETVLADLFKKRSKTWPRDYKNFFMLNSIEYEIFPAH